MALFDPIAITTSAFFRSQKWFVIAPRPNVPPSPETVELWHTRAWCSRNVTPSPRISFWTA
jgi:hypothetical protein